MNDTGLTNSQINIISYLQNSAVSFFFLVFLMSFLVYYTQGQKVNVEIHNSFSLPGLNIVRGVGVEGNIVNANCPNP